MDIRSNEVYKSLKARRAGLTGQGRVTGQQSWTSRWVAEVAAYMS